LGTGSLSRIEKKLDDVAAEIRAGQHEPSVITAVNENAGSSQNEAWGFLFREIAGDSSRDEIEAYRGEIRLHQPVGGKGSPGGTSDFCPF
jgi:hypothetical protein